MDQERMRERGAPFTARRWALLRDYSLRFNKLATGENARDGEGKGRLVLTLTTTDGASSG